MSVTLRDLLEVPDLSLTLLAGEAGLDAPLRLVHTSELSDPTPWLSGRELLLTTGMSLDSAAAQKRYVELLVAADVAGLGFGVGFGFDETPRALATAAEKMSLPLLEVPYPVPFIAIAEEVFSRLAEERVREAQLSVEVHERLAALVSEGAGPADVMDQIAEITGGWAMLFGPRGDLLARSAGEADRAPRDVWDELPEGLLLSEGATASVDSGPFHGRVAVPVRSGRSREGVLVLGRRGHLENRDRIVVRHAATLLGLLLASRRSAQAAERRVAGDVLQEAFAGAVTGQELVRRLELTGFREDPLCAVVVEGLPPPDGGEDQIEWTIEAALAARTGIARAARTPHGVVTLVPAAGAVEAAHQLLEELSSLPSSAGVRIGVGASAVRADVRQTYLAALFALRAAPADTKVASQEGLGAYRLLLGGQPEPVLRGFVGSVLGPLIERDRDRGSELLESIEAFVDAGGRWEPGAARLGIHRHTLRYRIQQAEDLLGRDLSSPHAQLEVLLALKAREILQA